jgi:drug/metabolite transporter (DMT)-like permease
MALVSGIFLGFNDIFTKKALEKSNLFNVLAIYTFLNFVLVSFELPGALNIGFQGIALIFLKSVLVYIAWILAFSAIQSLPISVISPFNTLNPMFSILFGIIILHENLLGLQIAGIVVVLFSYYLIGKAGAVEVKGLFKNRYLYFMVGSTFLSAITAFMDKIILKTVNAGQMQFWFCFFAFLLYAISLVVYRIKNKESEPIRFNVYIILMSIFLVVSDRIYFYTMGLPESKMSIVLPLRRVSIIVSTMIGGFLFKEKNLKRKFFCVCLIIAGIVLIFSSK